MINIILYLASFIVYGYTIALKQTESCEVCTVDSTCTDDTIYFNISVTKGCPNPLKTYFTYYTDVYSKIQYYNTTITCTNCYTSISLDAIRNAWDYTLTLKFPEPSKNCPTQHVAHCGGQTSLLVWYIIGGLSGLFAVFGVLLCCIKYYRKPKKKVKRKKKKVEIAVINA